MKEIEVEFARVVRLYYSRLQAQLAQGGLFRGQPPIMALLRETDGMSQKELAQTLNLSPATITVTLKRMERAGLVKRDMDNSDQRVLRVHLTEEGKRMCAVSDRQSLRVAEELLQGFSTEERTLFENYLRRIAANMERALHEDPGFEESDLEAADFEETDR